MGMSLAYVSCGSVPADVQTAVLADAEQVNDQRDWWCEPIYFFPDPEYPEQLGGSTKLMLFCYTARDGSSVEVDPHDDCFMAGYDARFIFDQLQRWSAEYDIDWSLSYGGEDVGVIRKGRVPTEADGLIQYFSSFAPIPIDDARAREHAREVLYRYVSRNE